MFAPLKTKKNLVTKQPAWYTNKLKKLRTKRNNAHKKWKLNQNNYQLLQTFRSLRDRFEKEIKLSKKNYYWNKFKNCIGDSRQTYKILNESVVKVTKTARFLHCNHALMKTIMQQTEMLLINLTVFSPQLEKDFKMMFLMLIGLTLNMFHIPCF